MESFAGYILTAFALVFVIEGLVYALFPDAVKKMIAMALDMPESKLRVLGASMAGIGFCMVWVLQVI